MYQDARLLVSGSISAVDNSITGQTVTGTSVTVLATNVIDLSQARDLGEGEDVFGRAIVTTAVTGGTSVEVQAIISASSNMASPTVIGTSGAIPVASLVAGKRIAIDINPLIGSLGQQYLSLQYVLVGAVATGVWIGDFGVDIQDGQKFYPSGFTVI